MRIMDYVEVNVMFPESTIFYQNTLSALSLLYHGHLPEEK